jgi:hypothetical protein
MQKSYAIIEIDNDKINFQIKYLKN